MDNVNLKLEAMGGLAAGVIGTVIGYPLDLIKTRMQTSTKSSMSNNMFQIGMNIVRKEGFSSLYKGVTPPLISLSLLNTVSFTSYNFFRYHLDAKRGWDYRNAIAGMMVGPLISSPISTVEHFVKTQMQMDNVKEKRYRSSWHCLITLIRERGLGVVYTGFAVNSVREGVFLSTYFYTYEGCRVFLHSKLGSENPKRRTSRRTRSCSWAIPIAGGISGAFAWFVSFPLDCIKARLQSQTLPRIQTKSRNEPPQVIKKFGSLDALKILLKTKGWTGFYSGITPSIMRAFIVSSTRFSAYEFVVWIGDDFIK